MPKIKLCGLSRRADINAVNAARPDYIGFVFAPSRRRVTPAQAASLRAELAAGIVPVGVFVNAPIQEILDIAAAGTIQAVQLHGAEDAAYIVALQAQCDLPVIQAVQVRGPDELARAKCSLANWVLLDSGSGSGQTFDWELLREFPRPYFLAGGIDEQNLSAALALSPYAVDISSGAETDGVKDAEKIRRLVQLTVNA